MRIFFIYIYLTDHHQKDQRHFFLYQKKEDKKQKNTHN